MSVKNVSGAVVMIGLVLSAAFASTPARAVEEPVLPERLASGLKASGPAEGFQGRKLFDYMDGGAEVYLAYGFEHLTVRNYRGDGLDVAVEIYRMKTPDGAFGIHAHQARGKSADVGVPALLAKGLLAFHKGNHYVRLVARGSKPARDALLAAGKAVAGMLPGKAEVPAVCRRLPEGWSAHTLRLLFHPQAAATVWFEGEGKFLLSGGAVAATASYAGKDGDVQLARVEYPSAEAAASACRALAAAYSLESPEDGCSVSGKAPDESFTSMSASGNVLLWVTGASSPQEASEWLGKLAAGG